MKSKIIFAVAFLAILIGVLGVYSSMNKPLQQPVVEEKQTATPTIEPKAEYVTVWRSTESISRGEPINSSKVKREQLLLTSALDEGIRSDVELDFDPTTLFNTPISSGQLILPEMLTKKDAPGYIDLLVTEGMTLYPLVVSSKNLISDFIRPGEHIDILTVSSPKDNLSGKREKPIKFRGVTATLFLQNIKVLNMGGSEEEQSVKPVSENKEDGFTTIIIEIPPEEVARLALAQRTMHLEVYRSREYQEPVYADVRNVMDNYIGVEELRGSPSGNDRFGGDL
ncbi:Flp pilus assembly protein CpaB [Vibrio mediterranei]|uniref:Flp pilus assembly protein CpaB n=1 Tax=Vibrio mediterranei TaxID=689 RepID=UPI0040690CA3